MNPCRWPNRPALRHEEQHRIAVVVQMIESWYAAGVCEDVAPEMSQRPNTNELLKVHFDQLMPDAYTSRIDFMQEVLKRYDVETARAKNQSFAYFCETHLNR